MLDPDKLKINTILTSISEGSLTISEVASIDYTYPVFLATKDYFDATLMVLVLRNATNTTYRLFYQYAETNGIKYNNPLTKESDVFIMGGAIE